jgi:metal-dependent amidase/aminoacylase/carboxypeptidase family protein
VAQSIKEWGIEPQLEKVIEFRHWMHQNAEGHLNEVNTQNRIIETLLEVAGIQDSQIKKCAGTGLIVEIKGSNQNSRSSPLCIALRADIDGLKMKEVNPGLPYASKTEYAHMCGHDGHTATLIMAACFL